MVIGIQDEVLRLHSLGLLNSLLQDKTTKTNILWATDLYSEWGEDYQRDKEIKVALITGKHSGVIKTRARKEMEAQSQRTRQHGEVATPLWVCRKMNDYTDEEWFGRPEVFFKDGTPTERVEFPEDKTWRDYVDSRRLEITCGEAPFLISRYDVSTGETLRVEERIGQLDRKLRVVGENTETEAEWLKWTYRAFEATYGYEFQGDNVLIARVNLLMTFEEYLMEQWHRKPSSKEYQRIANIIVWNLWQMDGLTGTIPYCKAEEEYQQMSLFDYLATEEQEEEKREQPHCRVFDWRSKCSLEYISMGEGRVRK